MSDEVRIERVPSRLLAVVRRRATAPQLARVVPDACGVVWNALRALQVAAGRHVALYWDDEINLEVGVEVDRPFGGDGDVVGSETPSGLAAATVHFGPYAGLHAAHDAIHEWCSRNGHTLPGPRWEIYGHWQDEWNREPARIRTDVYYLVR